MNKTHMWIYLFKALILFTYRKIVYPTYAQQLKDSFASSLDCVTINLDLKNCTCAHDYIDCNGKGFLSLPVNFSRLPSHINRLLFSNNKIETLTKIEIGSSSLQSLDLSFNRIKNINQDAFQSISKNLEYLNMNSNVDLTDLNDIGDIFANMKFMQINDLERELRLKAKYFNNKNFPSLNTLYLNNAGLNLATNIFDRLDKLVNLRIDSNNGLNLDCASFFSSIPNLISLNMSNISINAYTNKNCVKLLNNLNSLELAFNKISSDNLKEFGISECVNLEHLDLSRNDFNQIPYEYLSNLKNLNSLLVSIKEDNFTRFKPEQPNAVFLQKLTLLDLSYSNIRHIPENSFSTISNELTKLILRESNIQTLDKDAFFKLINLVYVKKCFLIVLYIIIYNIFF
jgi:Leucine-rich repeat (LRR) protein